METVLGTSIARLPASSNAPSFRLTSAKSIRWLASACRHTAAFLLEAAGQALVLDREGQARLGFRRFAALVEPLALLGEDDAEVALELRGFGSIGDEFVEVGDGFGKEGPASGRRCAPPAGQRDCSEL